MFRKTHLAALLAAAAGTPYIASETDLGRSTLGRLSNTVQVESVTVDENGQSRTTMVGYGNHAHHEVEKLRKIDSRQFRYDEDLARKLGAIPQDVEATPKLAGIQVDDLRQVMRFDISPSWVLSHFARVSTVLADLNLEGLRVPVVTGTRADDLAGTITYYFDSRGKLQRLTVHGFTGDPSKMVQIVTRDYGLQSEPTLEAGVYTKRWNGRPMHFLRLTHAPVVYSDAVHQKYTVFMELNQPNLPYGISAEARRIVDSDRHSGRW
ncbi:hypothetical protein N9N28_06360 [Rubripirellula amarantea]|uniref:DUF6690 domain-containing protein n=1 Tax=Rubripirellula amarantea TaxID=2527999 RepID=A0A5C5WVF9_9BACT|nr:DUF6690 family protein [Rubripirellula amarantea]MDA8744239.1 hypothetical protein [Rubripirellula amarantea]TWT54239.1 hypothetical protein Pla22_18800 [Rubripirellula amarantea]